MDVLKSKQQNSRDPDQEAKNREGGGQRPATDPGIILVGTETSNSNGGRREKLRDKA